MKAICLLLPLFALPVVAVAGECFCLVNQDDHFRHSCEMQQQGPRQVAQCRDDDGDSYPINDMTGWTKFADGQGLCKPCKQTINTRGGDIRGNNDQLSKDAPQ